MTERRLLYLDTHRLSAYAWRQGQLSPEGVFESDSEDLARFGKYLLAHRHSHFSLLANVAEEGHALESIPFLRGNDREALIRRKIGQHFLGTPLATAISLGYEKTSRKNEKLLISALTNPAHFEPWLQRMQEAEVPLAGIYTVAQLGGRLLGKIGQGKGRALLLTLQDHSIRESYLIDGQVHFSRMAPLTDSSIAGLARSLAAESGKLHQYLIGQRLVARDEALPVYIVAHAHALPAIKQACPDRGQLNFHLVDCHQVGHTLKLKTLPEDCRSDTLFLQLLVASPPRAQFASVPHRHHYRLSQIRQGLLGLGLIALLASLLFSAKAYFQTHQLQQETQALAASESELDWRYREISATFPKLDIDNETLRRLTNQYRSLKQQQRQPNAAYRQLSQALDRVPSIVLDTIDWKIVPSSPSTATFSSDNEEVTTVGAHIQLSKSASARQVLAELDQFVDLLQRDPENTVKVVQQPIRIESGATLRGGNEEEKDEPKRFIVEVSRKITP